MGFYIGNTDQVRVSISHLAYEVIRRDIFSFDSVQGKPKESRFLNRMLNNFYPLAESSIMQNKQKRIEKYNSWLKGVPDAEKIAKTLAEKEETSLYEGIQKRFPSAPRGAGHPIKLCITNSTKDFLKRSVEDKLYQSCNDYLAALIQEYAVLPRIDRERIYFADYCQMLELCIEKQQEVVITVESVNGIGTFSFLPTNIQTNGFLPYNYVIGYSTVAAESVPARAAAFRLQRIRKIRLCPYNCLFISKQEKEKLEKAIKSPENTSYLIAEEEKIVVRLTANGYRLFHHSIFSGRPHPVDTQPLPDGSYRMEFNCTQEQARQYFMRYGCDAEVLEPLSLRKKFAKTLRTAAAYYEE